MGFSTLLDIIGSMVIGGMLFLILLNLNEAAVKNSFRFNGEMIVQKNLVEIVKLLEHDFRKIGYSKDWELIPDPSKSILTADSTSISFLTDTNNIGIIDTLEYRLGPASELSNTPNPRDKILYRIVNGDESPGVNLGVTQFRMNYFDTFGNPISFPIDVPSEINTMEINLTVEDVSAYDDPDVENDYNSVFWKQIRLAARNLSNR